MPDPLPASLSSAHPLLAGAPRQVLERVLHPMSPEQFIADFGKKPIFIKGHPDKFAGLFDEAGLHQVHRQMPPESPDIRAGFPNDPLSYVLCRHDQIRPLYNAGATICTSAVHRHVPRLAQLVASIKSALHFTGMVGFHCYWSPRGSGFRTHYDARTATTLQLTGSKTWRYSREPAVVNPTCNAVYDWIKKEVSSDTKRPEWENPAIPDESTFESVLLEPGDIFSLPPGHWHEAAAGDFSLGLNLFFQQSSFLDELIRLVVEDLHRDPVLRGALPMRLEPTTGPLPDDLRAHVGHLLDRLKTRVGALDVDSEEVRHRWRATISTIDAALVTPTDEKPLAGELSPDQRLRVKRSSAYQIAHEIEDERPRVVLFFNGERISLPRHASTLLDELLTHDTFVASEALGWGRRYKWEQLRVLLEELIGAGALAVLRD